MVCCKAVVLCEKVQMEVISCSCGEKADICGSGAAPPTDSPHCW